MRIIKQFERRGNYDKHIVCGHFNREEAKYLKSMGYKETWREPVELNKNGIPIRRIAE